MGKVLTTVLAFLMAVAAVKGDDLEAARSYDAGREAYLAADYYKAGKLFEDARLLADTPTVRANSLLGQIGAWRMCGLPYREFKAIEQLLSKYPEFADYPALTKREFEIGMEFHHGKREPIYWALRWIPWLVDEDRTVEVLNQALKQAPYSDAAPAARLALAYHYDQQGMTAKSLEELRRILHDFPKAPECKFAALALGNGLAEMARRGDGDGRFVREARAVLEDFVKRYPDATEVTWANRKIMESKDIQAERLYQVADFYRRRGRKEAAERYLAQILKEFPDSLKAENSEALLVKLDRNFVPGDFPENPDTRLPKLKAYAIPKEAERVLISPLDSRYNYLLPVPDLRSELLPDIKEAAKEDKTETDGPETEKP